MKQIFLDKLFVKNKVSLTVRKLQLVRVFPYIDKSSLVFGARLRGTIAENLLFCKLNIFLDPLLDLVASLDS